MWTFVADGRAYFYSFPQTELLERAIRFAHDAHQAVNQKRKYSNDCYIVHPLAVADLVFETVGSDEEAICAALLHDTVEDTMVTLADIESEFGIEIANLVEQLTDVSKPEDGNRKVRKQLDLEHTAKASPKAKTIKLADLIANSIDIVAHDHDFAKVYLLEKEKLLAVLQEGDERLFKKAGDVLIQSKLQLMEK